MVMRITLKNNRLYIKSRSLKALTTLNTTGNVTQKKINIILYNYNYFSLLSEELLKMAEAHFMISP